MRRGIWIVVASWLAAGTAQAGVVPPQLTQQGRLFHADGTPATGAVTMVFKAYAAATGGTALWSETQTVTLDDGYFSVQLASNTQFPSTLWDGSVRYLGVSINSDPEMTPREQVVSVPYALIANDAVGDIHPNSITVNGTQIVDSTGHWVGPNSGLVGPPGTNGTNGTNGVSVTSTTLSVGNSNCPNGGSSFTSASGTTFACNGANGMNGTNGTNGTDGTNGTNGVSVTSTTLPVGNSNCPNGGTSFTSSTGTTFACNGAPGASGTTGQTAVTALGTAPITLNPGGGVQQLPGLFLTVNIPASSMVMLSTDGAFLTNGGAATDFSVLQVGLLVDGGAPAAGGFVRVYIASNTTNIVPNIGNWSFGHAIQLTAGSHTFAVAAQVPSGGGSAATVSGNNTTALQGTLTVMVLKQ